jgi:transposase
MHIEHYAGDKMFIDFAGEKLHIVNKETGEITEAEVFISVLGASQLTYVETVLSQCKEDFM